jgi:hypothetical protein
VARAWRSIIHLHVYTPNLLDAEAPYQGFKDFASRITFGEVGSMGTSMWEIEKLPLRNNAVFPPLLWIGKWCKTPKPPRFTKCGQEPSFFTVRRTVMPHP